MMDYRSQDPPLPLCAPSLMLAWGHRGVSPDVHRALAAMCTSCCLIRTQEAEVRWTRGEETASRGGETHLSDHLRGGREVEAWPASTDEVVGCGANLLKPGGRSLGRNLRRPEGPQTLTSGGARFSL